MAEVDAAQLEEVGQRIAAARRAARLTQRELAESLGTSLGRVDRYELGRSDPSEHLERVAKVTRRSMRWLLTGSHPDETDEAMLAALGRRVQEARHAAGLTESELAAKLGVAEEKVTRYESGQDDASTLLDSIAQATGSSRAWLRGETDEQDELDRLFSALAQQRDETKQRQAELDRLKQELQLRQSDLEEREQLIRRREEEFQQEAELRLRELEELHRNVAPGGTKRPARPRLDARRGRLLVLFGRGAFWLAGAACVRAAWKLLPSLGKILSEAQQR